MTSLHQCFSNSWTRRRSRNYW